jgi:hypothetical protein
MGRIWRGVEWLLAVKLSSKTLRRGLFGLYFALKDLSKGYEKAVDRQEFL